MKIKESRNKKPKNLCGLQIKVKFVRKKELNVTDLIAFQTKQLNGMQKCMAIDE